MQCTLVNGLDRPAPSCTEDLRRVCNRPFAHKCLHIDMASFFLLICICCSDHESSLADLKNKPRSFIKRVPPSLHPSMLFKLSMTSTVINTSTDLETIDPNKYKSLNSSCRTMYIVCVYEISNLPCICRCATCSSKNLNT